MRSRKQVASAPAAYAQDPPTPTQLLSQKAQPVRGSGQRCKFQEWSLSDDLAVSYEWLLIMTVVTPITVMKSNVKLDTVMFDSLS